MTERPTAVAADQAPANDDTARLVADGERRCAARGLGRNTIVNQ